MIFLDKIIGYIKNTNTEIILMPLMRYGLSKYPLIQPAVQGLIVFSLSMID